MTIRFSVRGSRPKPWGTNEWQWRKLIADEARKVRPVISTVPSRRFQVQLVFFLSLPALARADLDNLAKPILDTLFRATYSQAPIAGITGVLFDEDDATVFRLVLEKVVAESADSEGLDVTIDWE